MPLIPYPLDIARVAMQNPSWSAQRQLGSLFSHLHPLKCQEIGGTQKYALERSEITPKREIKSNILNSLDM